MYHQEKKRRKVNITIFLIWNNAFLSTKRLLLPKSFTLARNTPLNCFLQTSATIFKTAALIVTFSNYKDTDKNNSNKKLIIMTRNALKIIPWAYTLSPLKGNSNYCRPLEVPHD